jgi:hypothetical protein
MIDGDHGLSRRRSRACHAGIAIAVEKTRRFSFVSLSQLNSTLSGTEIFTESSIIFWITSATRATVARSAGQVNQIPSWRRRTIFAGRPELWKAWCSSNSVILNTSASSICTTAFLACRFSRSVSGPSWEKRLQRPQRDFTPRCARSLLRNRRGLNGFDPS